MLAIAKRNVHEGMRAIDGGNNSTQLEVDDANGKQNKN